MEGEPNYDYVSENEALIASTTGFESLYEVIRKIGTIRGTGKDYSAERMIEKIEEVRSGKSMLEYITRTYGLRDKVKELLG